MKRQTPDALRGAAAAALVFFAALASASASSNAAAQTPVLAPPEPPEPRAHAVGDATRAWLELQRSSRAAAPALPTLGAQASLAYQRYLDSFKTKIPAMYGSAISDPRANVGGDLNGGGSAPTGSN